MLDISQKQAIYQICKSSYVISSKTFSAQKIYSNQELTVYPTIILSYLDEENQEQTAIGDYIGTDGSLGQRSLATLSINIYAEDAQGLNAHQIGSEIARMLSVDIRDNWHGLASGTVEFRRKSGTRNLSALIEQQTEDLTLSRFQFDVTLGYELIF